jgi:hypothetical protein
MAIQEEYDLGDLITLVRDKPEKYYLHGYHYTADSGDPFNRIPYLIHFSSVSFNKEKAQEYFIRITDRVYHTFHKNSGEMFYNAAKYGIICINRETNKKEFLFTTEEYEAIKSNIIKIGTDVRKAILEFVYKVNIENPAWNINEIILAANINGEIDQIKQWAEYLVNQDYLIRKNIQVKDMFKNMTFSNLPHYILNPKMQSVIESELKGYKILKNKKSGKPEIFMSYSHHDKELAGQIRINLEKDGFMVFLAHDVIKVNDDWRTEILKHLNSCGVLLALVTNKFNDSDWTHQEAGFALGSEVQIISLMLGGKLKGFLEARQALNVTGDNPDTIAAKVVKCIIGD